jgi:hypothetical protein
MESQSKEGQMQIDPTGAVCAVVAAIVTGAVGYKVGQRKARSQAAEPLGPAVLKEDVAKMCRAHLACRNKGIVYGPNGPRLCDKAKAKFHAKHGAQVVEHQGQLHWRMGAMP